MSNSPAKTFYDIHCHTINLSHPCLYAFIRRYTHLIPLAGSTIGFLAQIKWIFEKRKIKNLLSIMERSVEEMLYAIESDLPILEIHKGQKFDSMVITPLLMDFWSDENPGEIDYPFAPKSIIPQVLDVFNGIAAFAHTVRGAAYDTCEKQFPTVVPFARQTGPNNEWRLDIQNVSSADVVDVKKVFGPQNRKMKVFPFMGINTTYCYLKGKKKHSRESAELETLLDKYFGSAAKNGEEPYQGTRAALEQSFGTFEGGIESLGRNYFAGIKLYPPLGFDPWPEDPENPKKAAHEKAKVEFLYEFCQSREIPITTHCGPGGYVVGSEKKAKENSHPRKWRDVLSHYPKLKLNLAHFGGMSAGFQYAAAGNPFKHLYQTVTKGGDPEWVEEIIQLIENDTYQNVYTDMGFSGVDEDYYQVLAHIFEKHPHVEERLLFGTDFSINLTDIESYKKYITTFLNTEHLTEEQKLKMCSINPEQFLFK